MNIRINVNCRHHDGYGGCNKKDKFLWVFNRDCVELNLPRKKCDIASRYPAPIKPPPAMTKKLTK